MLLPKYLKSVHFPPSLCSAANIFCTTSVNSSVLPAFLILPSYVIHFSSQHHSAFHEMKIKVCYSSANSSAFHWVMNPHFIPKWFPVKVLFWSHHLTLNGNSHWTLSSIGLLAYQKGYAKNLAAVVGIKAMAWGACILYLSNCDRILFASDPASCY